MSYETIAPCKGCKDRYVGCHDKCDKYLAFRKQLDERNAKEHAESKVFGDFLACERNRSTSRYRKRK